MTPEQIERVFGRGRLKIATGPHVEVFREAALPGERRRYTKRFLSTPEGDFREWTERESRILARLYGHGVQVVPEMVQFDRGALGGTALVQTYDAGVTVDHWATLLPVMRNGQRRAHVFEDCAHWWALAHHCLAALGTIHPLRLVHLDIKADNVCIPADPPDFDPLLPGRTLRCAFERLALIDFAFSLVTGERLATPLPIGWQREYPYQSPRLLDALEAGRRGDLQPTALLDWRCDMFSLAAMLRRYLPSAARIAQDGASAGWTPQRYVRAQALLDAIEASHAGDGREPAEHPQLLALSADPLRDSELAESLARGWTLATLAEPTPARVPATPLTRIAPPVRPPGGMPDDRSATIAPRPAPAGRAAPPTQATQATQTTQADQAAWPGEAPPTARAGPQSGQSTTQGTSAPPRSGGARGRRAAVRATLGAAAIVVLAWLAVGRDRSNVPPQPDAPSPTTARRDGTAATSGRSAMPDPAPAPAPNVRTAPGPATSADARTANPSAGTSSAGGASSATPSARGPAPSAPTGQTPMPPQAAERVLGLPPRSTPSTPAPPAPPPAPQQPELAQRAQDLLTNVMPRVVRAVEPKVSEVLYTAANASGQWQDRAVQQAATNVIPAVELPSAAGNIDVDAARRLNTDAMRAYREQRDPAAALQLQTRAFGANPLDPEIAGNLAFYHLRVAPQQPERARQLALYALGMRGRAYPAGRVEDWFTLAAASALSRRRYEPEHALFVALAVSGQLDRTCRTALGLVASYGEPLKAPAEALLARIYSRGRSAESPYCAWPPNWAAVSRSP